ncbi:MAG: hypothetical protein ACTHU0_24895 [Kofleriaceae bacterium]
MRQQRAGGSHERDEQPVSSVPEAPRCSQRKTSMRKNYRLQLALMSCILACTGKSDDSKTVSLKHKSDGVMRGDKPGQSARETPDRTHVRADQPIEHVERCPGARAVWRGVLSNGYHLYKHLTLEIDGATRTWTHDLEDYPDGEASSFGIFSPDCRHALLLQAYGGPYHIIRMDRLAEYAAGGAPDYELHSKPSPDGIMGSGAVRGGIWLSNSEVEYLWGCCLPPYVGRFSIPSKP